MRPRRLTCLSLTAAACALMAACGSDAPADVSTPTADATAIPAAAASSLRLLDWPEFGLDPQRSDVSARSTGITAANVAHLHRRTVATPGPVTPRPSTFPACPVRGPRTTLSVPPPPP